MTSDPISPAHYQSHPSGVQCIEISRHFGFMAGNAIKYVWRCGLKGNAREDLMKAHWYLSQAFFANETVHWPASIEPLIDRVLSCEASSLTRTLEALVGKVHHHSCRPRDIRRAIEVLDAEIARVESEAA